MASLHQLQQRLSGTPSKTQARCVYSWARGKDLHGGLSRCCGRSTTGTLCSAVGATPSAPGTLPRSSRRPTVPVDAAQRLHDATRRLAALGPSTYTGLQPVATGDVAADGRLGSRNSLASTASGHRTPRCAGTSAACGSTTFRYRAANVCRWYRTAASISSGPAKHSASPPRHPAHSRSHPARCDLCMSALPSRGGLWVAGSAAGRDRECSSTSCGVLGGRCHASSIEPQHVAVRNNGPRASKPFSSADWPPSGSPIRRSRSCDGPQATTACPLDRLDQLAAHVGERAHPAPPVPGCLRLRIQDPGPRAPLPAVLRARDATRTP